MTAKKENGNTEEKTPQSAGVATTCCEPNKNASGAVRKLKSKKCRECGDRYTPRSSLQIVCGVKCSIAHAGRKRKNQHRADKIAINKQSRTWWLKKTQSAVNKWVRDRDAGLPCISCGCPDGKGKRNAGHYRPAGVNSALRFDPLNIHGQCERCNTYRSGNLTAYRDGLIAKIGIDAVAALDASHEVKSWSIPELEAVCQAVRLGECPYTSAP